MGINQVIALKEEHSFHYVYVKVHYYGTIFIKFFTTCEWHLNWLDINYEIQSLLHNSMLAKVLELYAFAATCRIVNAKLVL